MCDIRACVRTRQDPERTNVRTYPRRAITRRPTSPNSRNPAADRDGASEPSRTSAPRQPGRLRTTRREPTSATAARATSSTVSSRPEGVHDRLGRPVRAHRLDHRGVDAVGAERVHPDPAGRLDARGHGDRDDGRLGRGVHRETGHRAQPGGRRDVDDVPAAGPNAASAARIPHSTPLRLTSTRTSTEDDASPTSVPSWPTPALLTQTASRPCRSASSATRTCAASSRTSCASPATAPTSPAVRRAAAPSTSVTTTAYPRSTSRAATARPMPRPAPVTTALSMTGSQPDGLTARRRRATRRSNKCLNNASPDD